MRTYVWAAVLGVAAMGAGYGVETATNGKRACEPAAAQQKVAHWSGYVAILKPETIVKKLGDGALTEEQLTKIKVLREHTMDKVQAWGTRPDVMQAREDLARAKKSGDQEAQKAAEAKLKGVGDGSEFVAAYKEGLASILSADQMTKLYPPKKEARDRDGTEAKDK